MGVHVGNHSKITIDHNDRAVALLGSTFLILVGQNSMVKKESKGDVYNFTLHHTISFTQKDKVGSTFKLLKCKEMLGKLLFLKSL